MPLLSMSKKKTTPAPSDTSVETLTELIPNLKAVDSDAADAVRAAAAKLTELRDLLPEREDFQIHFVAYQEY
ncbi:MAG: hypothetical protein JSW27_02165 [Phycisphaerales bacterium]|nr:MAG: hypothetical protein JSW27_02165 [Phycisphaerales bacterium]